jgi:hypothetical protein
LDTYGSVGGQTVVLGLIFVAIAFLDVVIGKRLTLNLISYTTDFLSFCGSIEWGGGNDLDILETGKVFLASIT